MLRLCWDVFLLIQELKCPGKDISESTASVIKLLQHGSQLQLIHEWDEGSGVSTGFCCTIGCWLMETHRNGPKLDVKVILVKDLRTGISRSEEHTSELQS